MPSMLGTSVSTSQPEGADPRSTVPGDLPLVSGTFEGTRQGISMIGEPSTPAAGSMREKAHLDPVRVLPRATALEQDRFVSHQKWEGTVISVGHETFWARLVDLTDPSHVDESAEFSRSELPKEDQKALQDGVVFYWNIGYRDMRSGPRIRASEIWFKRSAPPSRMEVSEAVARARHLIGLLVSTDE